MFSALRVRAVFDSFREPVMDSRLPSLSRNTAHFSWTYPSLTSSKASGLPVALCTRKATCTSRNPLATIQASRRTPRSSASGQLSSPSSRASSRSSSRDWSPSSMAATSSTSRSAPTTRRIRPCLPVKAENPWLAMASELERK